MKNSKYLAAIVIPVYKSTLTHSESVSLEACKKTLSKWPIYYACPDNLKTDYFDFHNQENVMYFNASYFRSAYDYNKLMLLPGFYEKFINYEYILIYQLDAYVFRDELAYWCNAQFSYIGAPWIHNGRVSDYAGNGGFSLRKVEDFITVLKYTRGSLTAFISFIQNYLSNSRIFPFFVLPFAIRRYFVCLFMNRKYLKNPDINEDYFFARKASEIYTQFSVAQPSTALRFSFEEEPELLYAINGSRLPFGCHAFEKYGGGFWKNHIEY